MKLLSKNSSGMTTVMFLICASLALSACVVKKRQVAQFDWDFKQIHDKTSPKSQAFDTCEKASKTRHRFVSDYEEQVFRYANGIAACMRLEGWGLTKNPVTFRDQTS